ncbi:MAG: InlB B-repeat-containing protein [Bacilli bacterium]|nr:InlB B-repeat-containing protein [Bacilli bacterium]
MKKFIYYFSYTLLFLGLLLFSVSCDENPVIDIGEVEVKLSEESVKIKLGETYKINYEVKGANGEASYDISDDSIISIDNGVVTALKEGKTNVKITVVCDDEAKTTKELTLSVEVMAELQLTISFSSSTKGFKKDSVTIKEGETYELGKAPTLKGYDFVCWSYEDSLDGEMIDEVSDITQDVVVYAIYSLKTFSVTYELDGGSYSGLEIVEYGQTLELDIPTKEGYVFLGWSTTKNSDDYVGEVFGSKDTTLYANWREKMTYPEGTYPIYYYLNGGKWDIIYYTPSELGEQFMKDFNASSGKNLTASDLDCTKIESSWFGDMMKKSQYLNKWMWLLDAIWEVAKGTEMQKAENADFGNLDVKGFYITNLNGFFTSTEHKEGVLGTMSANYADEETSKAVYTKGPAKTEDVGAETYKKGTGISKLPKPVRSQYIFLRWEDMNGKTVTSISKSQTGEVELKAIWEHEIIAEDIIFVNYPDEGIKLYDSLQLNWQISPSNAVNKKVTFNSLDNGILTISSDGLITTKTTGNGRVRVRLDSNPNFELILDISVWKGDYFDATYETNSYVEINETIKLNASYVDKNQDKKEVSWKSLDTSIATVDANGNVKGINSGVATIKATSKDNPTKSFDFYVTVLPSGLSDEVRFVVNNHISNAQTTYNLGIGSGNPEYYYDVVGGVNNLIFDNLKIDKRYYDKLPNGTKNYGPMTSVEFVTVHYTGNMKNGADADNNCSYFNNLEYRASIHFVTGRTNLTDLTGVSSGYTEDAYYVFAGLSEKYGGWHATNGDPCVWDDTGLSVLDGEPLTPIISISANKKYTINGRETTISIPTPPSGYSVDGSVLTVSGKQYSVFNDYGLITKVVDGKYYLARTHWGTQRTPRAICTCGGNRNSIGIESCVDIGSDLEHTWHVTAQLVAKLLKDYNLGFDRVVGHHFFSGKDCPQPFLERDMKLWYEFMDMVKAEYDLLTTYKNVTLSAKAVKGDGILKDNGLLVQTSDAHCVTYEVTVKVGNKEEKITLATCVESFFAYSGSRTYQSLQMQGYPII